MRKMKTTIALALAMVLLAGCSGKSNNNTPDPSKTPTTIATPVAETPAPTPNEVLPEGMAHSKLTNELIPEDKANSRPYAIMLSNITVAAPQSGISQASILYECLVEGGITRFMGIFDNFDADRIGSVRSARHYYVSIADEYDAIYVHYGQSKYTQDVLDKLGVENLSGLAGVGSTVFYRDNNISAPHNAFASYDGIVKGTEKMKYNTAYRENMTSHYEFYDTDTDITGTDATKVTVPFSKKYSPVFDYDATNKVYLRSQFGAPHVDATTKEQLKFKNILIQFVEENTMDEKGRQDMNLSNASGKGYYITNGKCMNITWKKSEKEESMSYFDEAGNKLTVNTGKTYIGLFPTTKIDNITFQ